MYCYNKCSSPSDIGNRNMLLLSCSMTDDLARGINNIRVHNIVITFIAKKIINPPTEPRDNTSTD